MQTFRGVGISDASQKIQLDRYSLKSEATSIDFLSADTTKRFEGWKTIFNSPGSWIQYNSVDFENNNLKTVKVRANSKTGGTIEICLDKTDGPAVAKIDIPKNEEWSIINSPLLKYRTGTHNVIVRSKSNNNVEIDWVSFE